MQNPIIEAFEAHYNYLQREVERCLSLAEQLQLEIDELEDAFEERHKDRVLALYD